MPRNPFDAIEAEFRRLLSAFSDEEVIACREAFSRRMKRIVARVGEFDQNSSGQGRVLTDREAIERYGTAALILRALVQGKDDPLWRVDLTGDDLSRRRDPRLAWRLIPSSQVPAGPVH
jgi:hypothetical protein